MTDSLLSVNGLTLERGGRRLLNNFSLALAAGDFVQIEGQNGSGKTSLLRYLAGLSTLSTAAELSRAHAAPLYVGHKPAIKTLLTPRENLTWHCRANAWNESGVSGALVQVGLEGYEDVLCQRLSAGQQRRASLARLYLSDSNLCLLDEPFTSIDRQGVDDLITHLTGLAQSGAAIVMTSHQPIISDYPLRRIGLGGLE